MNNEYLDGLVVVKRSGQRVDFNASKIAIAIKKAFDSIDNNCENQIFKVFEKVLKKINDNYKDRKTINVEDIQDIIENTLKEERYYNVYDSFHDYRNKRAASRKVFAEKQQHKFIKAIEKIVQSNNLNKDKYLNPYNAIYKFGKIVASEYNKSYVLDNKFVKAIEEGNIYVHDIDYFNLGIFESIHLKPSEKIINDFNLDKFIQDIIKIKEEVSGEICIDSLDKKLEPLIINLYHQILKEKTINYLNVLGFKEYLNLKKIFELFEKENNFDYQNFKEYELYLDNQVVKNVFLNHIFKDSKAETLKDLNKILNKIFDSLNNNYIKKALYSVSCGTNTSQVGLIINEMIMDYFLKHDDLENVHLIIKDNGCFTKKIVSLMKEGKTFYLVFPSTYNKGKNDVEYFTNGMRIYENVNSDEKISGGRMVVATASINMARLALKSKDKGLNNFYEELGSMLEFVKNELLLEFEIIGNKNKDYYQTLFQGNVYDDEKLDASPKTRKVIKNGTLNIGLIGLKECLLYLEKESDKQEKLLINILKFAKDKCYSYQEENRLNLVLNEPFDEKGRSELLAIDKSIYGSNEFVAKEEKYGLIYELDNFKNNYNELAKVQEYFQGGELVKINVSKNDSEKKLFELIADLKKSNLGFIKIESRKK